jgi:hypothetical protein
MKVFEKGEKWHFLRTPRVTSQKPIKRRVYCRFFYLFNNKMFINISKILSALKEGLHSYCDNVYSCSSINQMWTLNNSTTDLLDNFTSRTFSKISKIQTFNFSTLYTTIPHEKLNTRLKEIIHNAFYFKNGRQRYKLKKFLVTNKDILWNTSHQYVRVPYR